MAPPRLKCLSLRHVSEKSVALRGVVSTVSSIWSTSRDILHTSPRRNPHSSSSVSCFHTTSSASELFTAPSGSRGGKSTENVQRLIINSSIRNSRNQQQQSADEARRLKGSSLQDIQKHGLSVDLSKQITRRWKAGDVYAPHDLSGVEMMKWKERGQPMYDVFDVLNFDPMINYKNFSIMSEYMTPMGRIKHSKETGLRPKNQRKIARAVRRSIGLGLMPSVYRHPEILMKMRQRHQHISPYRKGPNM